MIKGKEQFKGFGNGVPLNIEVQAITASARKVIEDIGGTYVEFYYLRNERYLLRLLIIIFLENTFSVKTVYFNKLGLFHFLRRPHESINIRFARPRSKKAHRYDVPVYTLPGREADIETEENFYDEEDDNELQQAQ